MHTTNLRKVGGSVMLAIPPAFLDQLHLQAGATVGLTIDHGRLVAEGSEAELEHSVRAGVRLSCEVDRVDDHLLASVRGIPGVTKVSGWNGGGEGRLEVEAAQDVRAAVSKTVVGSGAALLGMTREEAGLEGVFMKLVKTSGSEGRT